MSALQILNQKLLLNLISSCKKDGMDLYRPFLSSKYPDNLEILEKNCKWLGIYDIGSLDLDFISTLFFTNHKLLESYFLGDTPKESVIGNLKIPELKKFRVDYTLIGTATKNENWTQSFDGYNEDYVAKIVNLDYIDGNFDPWSGDFINDDTSDFEVDRLYVDDVSEVDRNVRESILSKLIIENTESVIDDLDLKTLLKLRDIINQKLSS